MLLYACMSRFINASLNMNSAVNNKRSIVENKQQ